MNERQILLLALCVLGCGGGTTATTDGGSAADTGGTGPSLVGTWGTTTCIVPDTLSCDYAITFGADGEYSVRQSSMNDPAVNPSFAGCTITLDFARYTYATADMRLTVTAAPGEETITRTGCTDPTEDQAAMVVTDFMPSRLELPPPGVAYTLTETELTIGPAGGMVLTRR